MSRALNNKSLAFTLLFPLLCLPQFASAMSKPPIKLDDSKNSEKGTSGRGTSAARALSLETLLTDLPKSLRNSENKIIVNKVAKLSGGALIDLIPEYTASGVNLRLIYTNQALSQPHEILKALAIATVLSKSDSSDFFKLQLTNTRIDINSQNPNTKLLARELVSIDRIVETLINAKSGSAAAKARWNKIESLILKNVELKKELQLESSVPKDVIVNLALETDKKQAELDLKAQASSERKNKLLQGSKKAHLSTEKIKQLQTQLESLATENNREGVAQLLEKTLPWNIIEPVEANAWKLFIEATRNPDSSNSLLAFKGLAAADKDLHKSTQKDKKPALVQEGTLENLINRWNQPQYHDPIVSQDLAKTQIKQFLLVDHLEQVAKNTKNKSFVSLRTDAMQAYNDMGLEITDYKDGKLIKDHSVGFLAVKIDARRLAPEFTMMKLLAPLVIFPDEIILHKEGSFSNYYDFEKTIADLAKQTGQEILLKKSIDSKAMDKFFDHAMKQQKEMMGLKYLRAISCNKIF